MRLALVSDLHLEHQAWSLDPGDADVVVAAGDIFEGASGNPVLWLARQVEDRPVVFVPGNHDFYGLRFDEAWKKWKAAARGSTVHVLDNREVVLGGVRFLGTPLWSGLDAFNPADPVLLPPILKHRIADFSWIFAEGGKPWTPARMMAEHVRAREFLDAALTPDDARPAVVVTHWAPARASVHPRFIGDVLSPYFVNNDEDLVRRAHLWCHGHMHDPFDYRVGHDEERGRVVCNPRGYVIKGRQERPGIYIPQIIDVPD